MMKANHKSQLRFPGLQLTKCHIETLQLVLQLTASLSIGFGYF
jgi:hypothetical protein